MIGSTFAEGILQFAVKNVGFGKSFKNRKLSLKVEGKIINTDIDVKSWKPEKTYYYEVNIGKTNSKFAEIIIENNIKLANITGNVIQLTR